MKYQLPLLLTFLARVSGWNFSATPPAPDKYSLLVPVSYNHTETQFLNGSYSGSYWMSAFFTGTNSHQYFVLSHNYLTPSNSYYRCSILDIHELQYSSIIQQVANIPLVINDHFDLQFGDYSMEALVDDNLSKIRTTCTWANKEDNQTMGFDFTWTADHPVIYNIGTGTYKFGTGYSNEWGIPSGRTEGDIVVSGEDIQLISSQSFTWYDRQWVSGYPDTGNWTWFELHLPNNIKASVWTLDNASPSQHIRVATLLYPSGQTRVVPLLWTTNYTTTWTSPDSGIIYPLEWHVQFLSDDPRDAGSITITSILGGQEISPGKGLDVGDYIYEGFIKVDGVHAGCELNGNAFGVVEMIRFI